MADAFPAQYGEQELSIAPLPRFGTSTNPMDESALSLVAAIFIGMTSAVLLIVCLNLASVVVARGQARRRAFAIRLALGSGRLRIIRQLMTEALVLGTLGALGGVVIGLPAIEALITTLLSRLPVSLAVDAGTTTGTLIGGLTFGIAAAVMFALGPALRQSRDEGFGDLKHALGEEARAKRRWLEFTAGHGASGAVARPARRRRPAREVCPRGHRRGHRRRRRRHAPRRHRRRTRRR